MRTEITYGGCHRVFDSPEGVHLAGVTVVCDGLNFSTINGLEINGEGARDEEIMLDCGVKIIFHYYSMPVLAGLMEEFAPFGDMKIFEISQGELYLFQTM